MTFPPSLHPAHTPATTFTSRTTVSSFVYFIYDPSSRSSDDNKFKTKVVIILADNPTEMGGEGESGRMKVCFALSREIIK